MDPDPLLRASGLTKRYTRRGARRGSPHVQALAGIDLTVSRGALVAIVGESGSGKSTLARCLARLEEPDGGGLWFDGTDLLALSGGRLRAFRDRIQLIFQDSATALSPRLSAAAIVSEPLDIAGRGARGERRHAALELMEAVGLPASWADRRPADLSGGQRQRLAIARALVTKPRLLVLDEAFTGLDASIQVQITVLLQDLRARHGLTYIFISHDLARMAGLADRLAIMFEGRIVEEGEPGRILADPRHPHTCALVAALPSFPGAAAPPALG